MVSFFAFAKAKLVIANLQTLIRRSAFFVFKIFEYTAGNTNKEVPGAVGAKWCPAKSHIKT